MTVAEAARLIQSGSIIAGSSVTFELELGGAKYLSIAVECTGANPITLVEFWGSPFGGVYGKDASVTTAFGTISQGLLNAKLMTLPASSLSKVLVALSSTLGTGYKTEMRAGY
jgi:hypothetical protein